LENPPDFPEKRRLRQIPAESENQSRNWSKDMRLLRQQQGQSAIEYVLVVGAVGVVIAGILMAGLTVMVPQFAGLMCSAVDTAGTAASCLEP